MDLGLQDRHAIVTGGVGALAKPSRGNWLAKGRCGDLWRGTRRWEAAERELAAETTGAFFCSPLGM